MKFHYFKDHYTDRERQWVEDIMNSGIKYWCGNDARRIIQKLKSVINERSKHGPNGTGEV